MQIRDKLMEYSSSVLSRCPFTSQSSVVYCLEYNLLICSTDNGIRNVVCRQLVLHLIVLTRRLLRLLDLEGNKK